MPRLLSVAAAVVLAAVLALATLSASVATADAAFTKRQAERWNDRDRERYMKRHGYTSAVVWGCKAVGPRTFECPNGVFDGDERRCRYFFNATLVRTGPDEWRVRRYHGKCLSKKAFRRAFYEWVEV